MNKYRIENPNNNKVREYKSRTTEGLQIPHDGIQLVCVSLFRIVVKDQTKQLDFAINFENAIDNMLKLVLDILDLKDVERVFFQYLKGSLGRRGLMGGIQPPANGKFALG